MAIDTNCPKCGQPAKPGMMVEFRKEGTDKPTLTQLYTCINGSTKLVPFPGESDGRYSEGDVEFVIVNGEKSSCRPAASEFA
jgi:hypothetical protein